MPITCTNIKEEELKMNKRNPQEDLKMAYGHTDESEWAEYKCMAADALPWYIQQYQQMLKVLEEIQWVIKHDGYYHICHYCGKWEGEGHSPDCTLGKLLDKT